MMKHVLSGRARALRWSALLGVVIAGLAASPALASTSVTDSPPASLGGTPCTPLTFTQALSSAGDSAWYTMVPGEAPDNLSGTGWVRSGGASIKTTTLADGTTGQVLDLPSGATAYTPPICIDEGFQETRAEVNDIKGSEGIFFYLQTWGPNGWNAPQNNGQIHSTGWGLSGEMNTNDTTPGWQLARFEFQAGGNVKNPSEFQMYNFWVDPRMIF